MLLCAFLFAPVAGLSASETPPRFGLPIDCELGKSCFVQNYLDHDKTGGSRDFRCSGRTYDGHDGTDFRVPSIAIQKDGVQVLAIADGLVTRVRDGVEDISVRVRGKASINGKECGNGAVIEHADGWSSQYCHMANQSMRIRPGQRVSRGQSVGSVGLSGNTEFPHLHLTIRHNGAVIDPFAYGAPEGSCAGGVSLWDPAFATGTAYRPSDILNAGFTALVPTMDAIETDEVGLNPVGRNTSIVAYVRVIGLRTHDEQSLSVHSPDGVLLASYQAPPLESDKAQMFVSTGRTPPKSAWPDGLYRATYVLKRDGREILRKTFEHGLPARPPQ
jgi:hypothetical protein